MSLRPVGKLLVVADPPEEQNGLILPEGAKGASCGIVVRVSDEVADLDAANFEAGDKVFYRGPTIDIDRQTIGGGVEESVKRETTKLISVEQIVAVDEGG